MTPSDAGGTGTSFITALTALISALAALIAAVTALVKTYRTTRTVNKIGDGLINAKATLAQQNQQLPRQTPPDSTEYVKPDPALVGRWASEHRVANAWDMGPKNWERCLHDLGYPGGVRHELVYEANGTLHYQ